jgi:hypothetical protein
MQYDLQIQDEKYQRRATINPLHEPHLVLLKESTSCVGNFRDETYRIKQRRQSFNHYFSN